MVRSSAPLSSAFYPNKRLLDQSSRTLVCQDHPQRIRRGTFTAVKHLEAAILDYIQTNNRNPKPFAWTATADMIFAKITNTL